MGTFITGDEEILAYSHAMREVFKIHVKHPHVTLLKR